MTKKKILLFIVEGSTEVQSLSTVLSRIFSSESVQFRIVHGDVLMRDFPTPDKIISAVHEQIKVFRGNRYKPSDICKVIHLSDTDGAYIADDCIVEDSNLDKPDYPWYTENSILTPHPDNIRRRNQVKRSNFNKLSGISKIGGIPYSLYYFSSNLDHVLYNRLNLPDRQKVQLAIQFDLQYADDPNAFIQFINDDSFAVKGTYHETWEFIKAGTRSLERHSNFSLCLPDSCDWEKDK